MKKLILSFLLLFMATLSTKAQFNTGWDKAMNFGAKGVSALATKFTANGDLHFLVMLYGNYEFAGVPYNSAQNGKTYTYDYIHGKITASGQQVLIRRFTAGAADGLYGVGFSNASFLADGSLLVVKGGVSQAVNYGNGVVSQLYGMELVKFDINGVAQWLKTINTGANVQYGNAGTYGYTLHALQENGQGNIYLMVEANNIENNLYPARVIKLNSAGDEVWHYEITNTVRGISSADNMPKQFVDDNGEVTFYVLNATVSPAVTTTILFNGESLPMEASYQNKYNNWLVHLDANGQKTWSHSTYSGKSFLGVNPQNGEIYFNYWCQRSPASPPVLAPFSTLPNLAPPPPLSYIPTVYNWSGLIAFDKNGTILRTKTDYPRANYLSKMVIADNGSMLSYGQTGTGQKLNAGENFVYESGVYHAAMTLDANFEPIKVFKTPEVGSIAFDGDKFAVASNFQKPATFGAISLTPSHIDGVAAKNDILIAQGDLANIPLTPAITTWTGSNSTNWTDVNNWTNGIPTDMMRASFSGTPANMPESVPASTKTGQIYIPATASLTLKAVYGSLNITDRIFNQGKLTLENVGETDFYGAAAVKGSGELYFKGASSIFVLNCEIENTLSFDNTLEISSANVVTKYLKFIGGNAKIKGNITVSDPSETAILGASVPSNFVNGILTRAVNPSGTYAFPLAAGNNGSEKLATVSFVPDNLVGVTYVSAKYTTGAPTNGAGGGPPNLTVKGSSVTSMLNGGFLTVVPNQQNTGGTYGLDFSMSNSSNTVVDPLKYALIKRDNNTSPWIFQGSNTVVPTMIGSGTAAVVKVSLNGITSFSDFAIGIGNNAITLPVTLTKFTAKAETKTTSLYWETASELNNDKFEIERSTNGKDFLKIGEVKGNGTSQKINTYSFRDFMPSNGLNYYRLKQVDFNWAYAYSDIKFVNFDLKETTFTVFPNPVTDVVNFSEIVSSITLYDLQGKLVMSRNTPTTSLKIPANLTKGVYVLKVKLASGNTVTKQIIVFK